MRLFHTLMEVLLIIMLVTNDSLLGRKFVDGSIGADLPMQKLSELFNVNFFIVSQVNPWYINQ